MLSRRGRVMCGYFRGAASLTRFAIRAPLLQNKYNASEEAIRNTSEADLRAVDPAILSFTPIVGSAPPQVPAAVADAAAPPAPAPVAEPTTGGDAPADERKATVAPAITPKSGGRGGGRGRGNRKGVSDHATRGNFALLCQSSAQNHTAWLSLTVPVRVVMLGTCPLSSVAEVGGTTAQ